MSRPRCGNDPRAQLTDGDRQAVESFKAYLADRAALRDRIAAAIYERNNPGHRWADAHPDDLVCYGNDADAAMTVLPPPVSRADVLRELADQQEQTAATDVIRRRRSIATARRLFAVELRRKADEAQPGTEAACTCADAGACFAPAGHYADCPAAAGAQQDGARS